MFAAYRTGNGFGSLLLSCACRSGAVVAIALDAINVLRETDMQNNLRLFDYHSTMRFVQILFVLSVLVCSTNCVKQAKPHLLSRVAVTGASVTAGQGVKTPPKKGDLTAYPMNMTHVLEGMIEVPHDKVAYFGDILFFRNPKQIGRTFIQDINDYQPTLLVALDFLFWFGHGYLPKDADELDFRMERLEIALGLLDSLDCEIVIGNFPDVSFATRTLLNSRQVPSEKVRSTLNARIKTWGESYDRVHVIDVESLWRDAIENNTITILDNTWENTRTQLLQSDYLHASLDGLISACLLMADCLEVDGFELDALMIRKNAAEAARNN